MNLKLITPMGTMAEGETFNARTQEQADMLVEQGFAVHIPDEEIQEKKLVLINPEPGTYTTVWQTVAAKESETIETSSIQPLLTAKELIEKVNAATTIEEVKSVVPETETRKTVIDAAVKKIDELKG